MLKNTRRFIFVCFLVAWLVLPVFADPDQGTYVEDEMFIKLYEDTSDQDARLFFEWLHKGFTLEGGQGVWFERQVTPYAIEDLYLYKLKSSDGVALDFEAYDGLRKSVQDQGVVYYSQANYKYKKQSLQGTELIGFEELWAFDNDGGQRIGQDIDDTRQGVAGMDLNILKAWELTKGHKDIIVMVADDGVDAGHLEFQGRIIQDALFNPQESLGLEDDFGDTFAGHGTHVAGTIGASWDQGSITGIAPYTSLLPINILSHPDDTPLNEKYGTSDSAISSIFVAKAYGVKIINNSWGSERWTLDEDSDEKILIDDWAYDMVLREAIESVEDEILYVVAAGNDGHNNDVYPSVPDMFASPRLGPDGQLLEGLKNVISVAALDNRGGLAEYSNYGEASVQISAPGWGIYSTYPLDEYTWLDGTSMAAPMVSGVAALMYAVNPDLSPEQVIALIIQTGRLLPNANDYLKTQSNKMVDAYGAVKAAKDMFDKTTIEESLVGVSPWAEAEVKAAMTYDLVTSDLRDDYQSLITRKEFAYLIVNMYESMTKKNAPRPLVNPFEDTSDDRILQAYALGVIKGKTSTNFEPDEDISRQEMAVMFHRALEAINPKLMVGNYSLVSDDKGLVAEWAQEAMAYMHYYEIINGVSEDLLDPLGKSSREVAILLVLRTYLIFNGYVDL